MHLGTVLFDYPNFISYRCERNSFFGDDDDDDDDEVNVSSRMSTNLSMNAEDEHGILYLPEFGWEI